MGGEGGLLFGEALLLELEFGLVLDGSFVAGDPLAKRAEAIGCPFPFGGEEAVEAGNARGAVAQLHP